MISDELKLVLVPWGADIPGEDIWLLENALILGLESVFEAMNIPYADLYDQLGGEAKRSSIVPPFTEAELLVLGGRAPEGTTAIIDGLITAIRDQATSDISAIEIAPRVLRIRAQSFDLPDAFRYQLSALAGGANGWFDVEQQERWHALIVILAEAILEPLDRTVPASIGPETLKMTESWAAYKSFIKAKRGTRTVDEKIGHYRQAVRLDPKFYWAHFNAGQLFKQQQDYHSARREFLGAVEGASDDPNKLGDTYFELGLCSIFLGDTKTARNFWDQALGYAPENPVLLVNLAGTYEQEEDWQNALRLHSRALEINPEYYKAIVSLARLKAQIGEIDEAIPLYEKALSIRPDDPLRHAILGGCYLAQGDEEKARKFFETASLLDPAGGRRELRIDEADAPPAPGEYARQELAKLDEAQRKKDSTGWRWFGR